MKISTGLILALAYLTMSVAAQFDNEVTPRDTRVVPIKLCGNHLFMALDAVCDMERHRNRGKRHAVPEPSYRMSPFMMSIYRPSIDDEDKWAADWADLKLESNPGRDIYNRISSLRVRILQILLRRLQESRRAFKILQEPSRAFRNQQEYFQDIKSLRIQ